MTQRFNYPFTPLEGTTAPSFQISGTLLSTFQALESSGLNRKWRGPSGRVVRLSESSGVDYYVNFGSTTVVAAATDSILVLGGTVETLKVDPTVTHIAVRSISTSTAAVVNVTPGYGQ